MINPKTSKKTYDFTNLDTNQSKPMKTNENLFLDHMANILRD